MEDDRNLLKRVAMRDQTAMRALYERHHDAVHAFLKARGSDPATASDVLHDAMLEVWKSADRFQSKSSVKTWIFAIARNKLVDRLRKASRTSLVDEVPDVADDAPNPEAAAMAANDTARLQRCLEGLSAPHRTALRLAFFDDLTYEEIGEIEGVPHGTIKTRIFHAKRLMMRCLGQR
ncbi:MAG: sigma-70 family RNA polymerase sigma factor [Pseudomonadota bacterium]